MANILDIGEYARFSFDELVDMIKNLEHRIEVLEDEYERGYQDGQTVGSENSE